MISVTKSKGWGTGSSKKASKQENLHEATKEMDKKLAESLKVQDLIYGTFFEVNGSVRVADNYPYCNYYPEDGGQPNIIWNMTVLEQAGMPFVAGTREGQTEPEVLWVDKSRLQDGQLDSPRYAQHWLDHSYGRGDPAWIDPRQITELRIYPTLNTLKVNISPGNYGFLGRYNYFSGVQNYDLFDLQPATGTKRGIGFCFGPDGTLQVVTGNAVAETFPLPPLLWPSGSFLIGLIILYGNKAYIDWEDCKNRKPMWSYPGYGPGEKLYLHASFW